MKKFFKMSLQYLLVLAVLMPCITFAFPQSSAVPGGIVLLPLDKNYKLNSARYRNKKIAVVKNTKNQFLLVGISLNTKPGTYYVDIKTQQGKSEKLAFNVKPKIYKAQYLTIKISSNTS